MGTICGDQGRCEYALGPNAFARQQNREKNNMDTSDRELSIEAIKSKEMDGVALSHFEDATLFANAATTGDFSKVSKIDSATVRQFAVLYGHLAPQRAFVRAVLSEDAIRREQLARRERLRLALMSSLSGGLAGAILTLAVKHWVSQ